MKIFLHPILLFLCSGVLLGDEIQLPKQLTFQTDSFALTLTDLRLSFINNGNTSALITGATLTKGSAVIFEFDYQSNGNPSTASDGITVLTIGLDLKKHPHLSVRPFRLEAAKGKGQINLSLSPHASSAGMAAFDPNLHFQLRYRRKNEQSMNVFNANSTIPSGLSIEVSDIKSTQGDIASRPSVSPASNSIATLEFSPGLVIVKVGAKDAKIESERSGVHRANDSSTGYPKDGENLQTEKEYWLEAGLVASLPISHLGSLKNLDELTRQCRQLKSNSKVTFIKGSYLRNEHALVVRRDNLWLVDRSTGSELFPLINDLEMRGLAQGDRFVPQQLRSVPVSYPVLSPEQKAIDLLLAAYKLGFGGLIPAHMYDLQTQKQTK